MDPLHPFTSPLALDGESLFADSLHPSHKIDAEVNTLLLEAKKELSHDAYKEFTAYMRGVARKLKLGAAAIYALNQGPLKIDAEVQRCRYVLQTAADEFSRHVMGFQENKAAVAATRQENDAAIDAMGRHFERLDIQVRLDSDPMWVHKKAQIDEHMAVAQMGAFVVEKTAEGVKWATKRVLGCTPGSVNEHSCRIALDFARDVGKQALDAVGLKESVKKVVKVVATPPLSLVQELERQFLIPPELSKAYYHNSMTCALAVVPLPPVLKMKGLVGSKAAKTAEVMPVGKQIPTLAELFGQIPDCKVRGDLTLKGTMLQADIAFLYKDSSAVVAKLLETARQADATTLRITGDFINARLLETYARRYGDPVIGSIKKTRGISTEEGIFEMGVYAAFDIPVHPTAPVKPSIVAKELSLVRKLESRTEKRAAIPHELPQNLEAFYAHDSVEYWPHSPSPTGVEMPFKASLVQVDKKALVLFEKTEYPRSLERFIEAGNEGTFQALFKDKMGHVLDDVREYASRANIRDLYVVYDQDHLPLLSSLYANSSAIDSVGLFFDPVKGKNFTLLEMGVN